MSVPLAIDPCLLAAEIEATVSEFNRLTALAVSIDVSVLAEITPQPMPHGAMRPVLAVQVIAPL
jgi:hypothetical protein